MKNISKWGTTLILATALLYLCQGCTGVSPSAKKTLPSSSANKHTFAHPQDLPINGIQNNFFGSGPDNVNNMLNQINGLVSSINQYASNCINLPAYQYTVTAFSGIAGQPRTIQAYAQCAVVMSPQYPGDPGIVMIGTNNGTTYVWFATGNSRIFATQSTTDTIDILYGVGYANNTSFTQCNMENWDDCPYNVAEIQATVSGSNQGGYYTPGTSTTIFEMTATGMNIGYCAVHAWADGTNIFAVGSQEGPDYTCAPLDTGCYDQTSFTTSTSCTTPTAKLATIGREQTADEEQITWNASNFPGTPNTYFDGTNSDDLHFGQGITIPTAVTIFPGPSPTPNPSPTPEPWILPADSSTIRADGIFVSSQYPDTLPPNALVHNGFHFDGEPSAPPVTYLALAAGTITDVQSLWGGGEDGSGSWGVYITIKFPGNILSAMYQFETNAGATSSDTAPFFNQLNAMNLGQENLAALTNYFQNQFTAGQYNNEVQLGITVPGTTPVPVFGGDAVGTMVVDPNAHFYPIMHLTAMLTYGVLSPVDVCPLPFFTPEAQSFIENSVTATSGSPWVPCYGQTY